MNDYKSYRFKKIIQKVHELRTKAHLSQNDLAKLSNLSKSTIAKMDKLWKHGGHHSTLRESTMKKIENVIDHLWPVLWIIDKHENQIAELKADELIREYPEEGYSKQEIKEAILQATEWARNHK